MSGIASAQGTDSLQGAYNYPSASRCAGGIVACWHRAPTTV